MRYLLFIFLLVASPVFAATYTLYPTSDTKINPAATTTNYDTSTTCGTVGAGTDQACLLHFDLTGITAESIISASLRVSNFQRGGAHNTVFYRGLRSWVSTQATWLIYSTGNSWGTDGATNSTTDYTTTNSVTGATPNGGNLTVDVTEMVKDMINNGTTSIIFRGSTGNTNADWRLSEYAGTTEDPQLSIQTGDPGVPTTWYVRTDGGTCGLGNQCDGITDAAYSSGTNQPCACSKPSLAAAQMAGEDIMVIKNGTYNDTAISTPSGTSTTLLTKVRGEGYANCTDPSAVTIWSNSAGTILTVDSYTTVDCLTLTDHQAGVASTIIDSTDTNTANNGLRIADDSTGVTVSNVTAYGLYRGLVASRLGDFTGNNIRLIGNWSTGWDSDVNADDGYTGTVTLNNATIDYNGCGMVYPLNNSSNLLDTTNFHHCCSQDQGCYGDGIGLGDGTAGNWYFNGGSISHNTSDGLDTLHGTAGVQSVKNVITEGNAGNQLKVTGTSVLVEDSKIIGNCGYFANQTFTTTPDQNNPNVGVYILNTGYAVLAGTGIAVTNETIGTGDGVTTVFSGTTTNFPIKASGSAGTYSTISYTQGGSARTATSGAYSGSNLHLKANIVGTGVSNAVSYSTSYINYKTGAYQITFSTPPDNATTIKFDSYTYDDLVPTGTYTGDRTSASATTWDVEVTGTGTPDVFKWRKNLGGVAGSYTTGVSMTGSAQLLGEGVSVQFKSTTGHTIGDVYTFSTVGSGFNNCRATGNPISLAIGTSGTAKFYNNTIVSNGDTTVYKNNACSSNSVVLRNNIIVGGTEFNDGTDKSRQFYADGAGCTISTLFDSNYDIMCAGKPGNESDCTGEGANNTCYTNCSSINFTTALDIGPSTYYTGQNMDVTLASSIGNADETVSDADAYDINYFNRGATWDAGAYEYGTVAATCSDSVQNGLETGVDCGGVCLTSCSSSTIKGGIIGRLRSYGRVTFK